MLELLAIAAGAALAGAIGIKLAQRKAPENKKTDSLTGAVFAVSLIESNGSVSDLENEVIHTVLSRGGRVVSVNRAAVREMLRGVDAFDRLDTKSADVLIAGTVVEETIATGNSRTYQSQEFVAWARQRYPTLYQAQPNSMYESEHSWQYHYHQSFGEVCAFYCQETGAASAIIVGDPETYQRTSADFRCYGADGSIVGAGRPTERLAGDRRRGITKLAVAIVDRLFVRLDVAAGMVEIQIDHRPVAIRPMPASATGATPAAAVRTSRPADDRPNRARPTTRLDD